MVYIYQIIFLALTYFVAAIPFGLVLAKIFGKKDIRKHGSNNIGATNVVRVLGKKLGLATLILDGAKGAMMIVFARYYFVDIYYLNVFLVVVGVAAVLGHVFPIYLKFKGGKGVATGLAVLLAIDPIVGVICLFSWLIVFIFTKISAISSLSSIAITVGFVFYYNVFLEEKLFVIFLAILIFIRHKENIKNILQGKENKLKVKG